MNARHELADAAAMRGNRCGTPVARAVRDPQEKTGTLVLKLGGRALDGAQALDELADDLVALGGSAVVIHGGGAEVTAWGERAGVEARFHGGRRVTDPAALDVAVAVLAGLVNKRLVAALRHRGLDAVGIAALDGGSALVAPHADAAALGAVGTVTAIDVRLIETLLAGGFVPVISSIGAVDGGLFNLNADDLAAALAPALGADALVLLSDTPGLLLSGAVVSRLGASELAVALASEDVSGGMRPKLEAAGQAVAAGVPSAWIAAWDGPGSLARFADGTARGTRIAQANESQEVPVE